MLKPGSNCWLIEPATKASVVIDAEDYFRFARDAMLDAKRRIMLVGWDFDARIPPVFALPEPKVGWAALSGGVQRLPRAIGVWRAMEISCTGRNVPAAEAHRLGIVSDVTTPADLLPPARALAAQIAACAPLAIRCAKQVAYASLDAPKLAAALDLTRYHSVQTMLDSEDCVEGRRAFTERRPPQWRGR